MFFLLMCIRFFKGRFVKVHYFSPGPASLPQEVIEEIHTKMLDTFGIGISVLEISHRSKFYTALNEETLELARRVFQVPDTHTLVFSVCGAQQHFSLLIDHLAGLNDEIAYTDTGVWAHLACAEAVRSGRKVHLVFNGAPEYRSLGTPAQWHVPPNSKFVHITVNNTVYGTEYETIPTFGDIPLVLDMTSSLGARTDIPWAQTGLIYASAQKNFGIAGVSVVIVRNDLLEKSRQLTEINRLGKALTYAALYDARSVLNTPPVFPIFCMNKMLHWIEKQGGVSAMETLAKEKARLIYDQIDQGFYQGRAQKNCRSRHNFVFCLPSAEQDSDFIEEAAKQNILEIQGYKTVGGIRASIYNGVSLESAKKLSLFIEYYRKN